MRKITHINGPVNVARLEGEIDGVKKILYLFMDIHYNLDKETKCNNETNSLNDPIKSKSIIDLLKDLIYEYKNSEKKYDLFIEFYETEIKNKKFVPVFKGRYIDEVADIFKDLFIFDVAKKEKKTTIKVKTSKEYSNFRWHYFDIRGRINLFNVYNKNWIPLADFTNKDKQLLAISKIIKELELLKRGIYENEKGILDDELYKHIDKIKMNYENDGIKKVLTKELSNLEFLLDKSIKIYQNCSLKIKNSRITNDSKEVLEIVKDFEKAYESFELYFASFVDLVCLRRILDKKYIETVFHYAGAYHSAFIIKTLINNFDFKITHISSHNPKKDPRKVKKFKSTDEVYRSIVSKYPVQCSNISDFPKMLS